MRELFIGGRRIADDEPAYLIAEVGNNHGGDVDLAVKMLHAAADEGADAVKFQRRSNSLLYSRELLKKPYDNEHSFGKTYGEHRDAVELTMEDYPHIVIAAEMRKIHCFATPFDELAADELEAVMDPPAYKIASGALTDHALLKHVACLGKPVILSTGGGTIETVDAALATLLAHTTRIAILHCVAAYPSAPEEQNLQCIQTLRERYPEFVIGFSSHSPGIAFSLVAYALGARIIEHHFTLDRASKGADHRFSLEPKGLRTLREDLDKTMVALGDGVKRIYQSEVAPISKMRRVKTRHGLQVTGDTAWASGLNASSPRH